MREEFLKKLGKNIAAIRKKKGFSQDDLYLEAEISRRTIYLIETGQTNPSIVVLLKISEALDVHVSDLLKFKK